jgi:cytochrome b561
MTLFTEFAPARDEPQPRRYVLRHYSTTAKAFHWLTAGLVFFMVASGVVMKQLDDGVAADTLFALHKLTGALTLVVILLRVLYRLAWSAQRTVLQSHRRPLIHWTLYGAMILMPLLGWAGASAYGPYSVLGRELFFGYSLPAIWPERAGDYLILLEAHGYLAFLMLALVAVHIGLAIQDHIMRLQTDTEKSEH